MSELTLYGTKRRKIPLMLLAFKHSLEVVGSVAFGVFAKPGVTFPGSGTLNVGKANYSDTYISNTWGKKDRTREAQA